jgi:hypothetical protein
LSRRDDEYWARCQPRHPAADTAKCKLADQAPSDSAGDDEISLARLCDIHNQFGWLA